MSKQAPQQELERAEAFGKAFARLMTRLTQAYETLAATSDDSLERERMRRRVAVEFENEAEGLISRYVVADRVAEYVRHVVREGFDADFDPMDPTEKAQLARTGPSGSTGWTTSAPAQPGPYALKNTEAHGEVELARFQRVEAGWLVYRWGVQGGVPWGDLERQGWRRWVETTRTPAP